MDIKITVKRKLPICGDVAIVCNNSDYTVIWELDEEWSAYDTKTMRTAYQDGTYTDTVFTGNTVALPVVTVPGTVKIGLYAGDIRTSRPALIVALGSITTDGGTPAAPSEDVYNQIMELIKKMETVSPEDIAKAVEDYLTAHPAAAASMRVEGGYIQFSADGKTWANVIALVDLKGAPGNDGEDGADGITPHIGDNGNWYLGTTDTGKPSRGPAGQDGKDGAGMDVTGATVGQIARISAVDDNGKPTAWEPVDLPSGGGGKEWELINKLVVADDAEETNALTFDVDLNGNAFQLKKARLCCAFPPYTGASTIPTYSFSMLNGKTFGSEAPLGYTSVLPKLFASQSNGCVWTVDVSGPMMVEECTRGNNWGSPSSMSRNHYVYGLATQYPYKLFASTTWAQPITSIGGTNMLIYPGCQFELYGVRA